MVGSDLTQQVVVGGQAIRILWSPVGNPKPGLPIATSNRHHSTYKQYLELTYLPKKYLTYKQIISSNKYEKSSFRSS